MELADMRMAGQLSRKLHHKGVLVFADLPPSAIEKQLSIIELVVEFNKARFDKNLLEVLEVERDMLCQILRNRKVDNAQREMRETPHTD